MPFQDEAGAAETPALENEFKHDINAYLAARPGNHPKDLAGLIAFNNAHAAEELQFFGQEIFEESQAMSGDLTDPTYLAAAGDRDRAAAAGDRRDAGRQPPRRDHGRDQRPGVGDHARPRRRVLGRLVVAGGGVRLPEHHGAGRLLRPAAGRGVVHRHPVRRGRPRQAGVRVREGHPGPPAAQVHPTIGQ
jgi:hypothetical protein